MQRYSDAELAMEIRTFMDLGWDPRGFLQRLDSTYKIINRKTNRKEAFGPLIRKNPVQLAFLKKVIGEILRGGPIRLIVLKSRKHGFSTLAACLIYDLATHIPNFNAGILSHDKAGTAVLRNMLNRFWMWTDPSARPELSKDNASTVRFGKLHIDDIRAGDVGLESTIQCVTARGKNPLTGDDIRAVLQSEKGKWNYDRNQQNNVDASVFNAVPSQGPTIIIVESTAQGTENNFYDTYVIAEKNVEHGKAPSPGEWIPHFAGAHEDPTCTMPVEEKFDWADHPAEDIAFERQLVAELSVTQEFLRWRRWKIREQRFDFRKHQEDFPCRPRDAFLATMMSLIPAHMLDRAQRYVVENPITYSLRLEDHDAPFGSDAVSGW